MSNLLGGYNLEKYSGGIVIRELIKPSVAERYGEIIINLSDTQANSSFYRPLFCRYEKSQTILLPNIKKAWLSLDQDKKRDVGRMPYDSALNQGEVDEIQRLADIIDYTTDCVSKDRTVIIYESRAALPTHEDNGLSTRLLTLSGKANFKWHSEHDDIVDRIDLNPGDLLWTDDSTPHSVQAISECPRVALGLIDAETKTLEQLHSL